MSQVYIFEKNTSEYMDPDNNILHKVGTFEPRMFPNSPGIAWYRRSSL